MCVDLIIFLLTQLRGLIIKVDLFLTFYNGKFQFLSLLMWWIPDSLTACAGFYRKIRQTHSLQNGMRAEERSESILIFLFSGPPSASF